MRTLTAAILLGLVAVPLAHAGGKAPPAIVGNWKVIVLDGGRPHTFWIFKFAVNNNNDLTGEAVPASTKVPATTMQDVKMQGGLVQLRLKIAMGPSFDFEARLPKQGEKTVRGSMTQAGNSPVPAMLEATDAKDAFELDREFITRNPDDPRSFNLTLDLIEQAAEKKVPAKQVRGWMDASLKSAAAFGPRWQETQTARLVEVLGGEPTYAELVVDLAERLAKSVDDKMPVKQQVHVLAIAAKALRTATRVEAAKALDERIDKLETTAYEEYTKEVLNFPIKKGERKAKGPAVLIELFTGAECPPCVAADLAFDAVAKAYGPADVVLLQYHMHIPRPDPLSTPDGEDRLDYYAERFKDDVGGTPAALFNGKPEAGGGGGRGAAQDKFKEYLDVLGKLFAKAPAGPALTAVAVRKGEKIDISTTVKDVAKPGDKLRLRLALVEERVGYKGGNGLSYHHRVVRDMPGGAKGFAITKQDADYTASVDLAELRRALGRYLDSSAGSISADRRPMRFRDLHVVAFVQDDATGAVLNAVDVAVTEK